MNNFSKKIGLETMIPLILIILLFSYFISYNQLRKKILIVHSYYKDYSWVIDLNDGLSSVLNNQDSLKIEYYYMDTKRDTDERHKEREGIEVRRLIDSLQPDVVIAFDDDAQNYVTQYYLNNPSISFVFSGVNGEPNDYNFHKASNVTGILERLPMQATHDAIIEIAKRKNLPFPVRAQHISSSNLVTVKLNDESLRNYKNWEEVKIVPSRLVSTFSEWKKAILDAQQNADFILISNCREITHSEINNTLVPSTEIMKWTLANTQIPVIGLNNFIVDEGAPLAISPSGYEQGAVAARMALKIIYDNIPANKIPVYVPKQFIVSMNPKLMEKFSMKLPEIYHAFARVAQKHLSEMEETP